MSSAEIKKPPVAPKPKFVVGHKATPPPVAPKPDVVLSGVIQAARKTKPTIAPKPKVLKSSSIPEVKPPSSKRKSTKSFEEHREDSSQTLDHLNYKNETSEGSTGNTTYILPVSSCKFECLHKLESGEKTCKTQIILEHFENLENIKAVERNAASLGDSHNEKLGNRSRVVLKASISEEKLKDVLTHGVFPSSSPVRDRHADKLDKGDGSSSKKVFKIEFMELVQSSSSSEVAKGKQQNTDGKIIADEFQMSEICPSLTENNHSCYCPLDQEILENENLSSNSMFSGEVGMKTGANKASPETSSLLSSKVLPIPKPRKPRAACLVRQDGIDTTGEGTKEPSNSEKDSYGLVDQSFKNPAKINVLGQSVCYNNNTEVLHPEKCEITRSHADKMHHVKESAVEDSASQNLLSQLLHKSSDLVGIVECSLDTDLKLVNSMDEVTDDSSMPDAVDKRTNFVRSDTLSMSLPKQLKLTCSQHSSASSSLHISPQNLENKEVKIKDENSPKVVPKKPQRHSLPAAGLLKKAASAELVDKSSYTSSENKSNSVLEGSHFTHPRAKEQGALSSCDIPKRSEKPVWKLPHPILPFPGNSESLKTANVANSFNHFSVVTKPRAKSLSAVDMDRTDKPCKDHQKKSSLKKFLNMKLSVCLMKSDFQKFLSKGSQSVDSAIANLSTGDGYGSGNNRNIASVGSERKAKSAKAHSVEISSPALQKKRQRNRSQPEMRSNQRLESLDRHLLLGENLAQTHLNSVTSTCAPEYENVRHYEEIPEYENLPFAVGARRNLCFEWQNSSSVEDQSTGFYEAEELGEATNRRWRLDRSLEDHHDHPNVVVGDIQSDEEDIMNSSDEDDDTNSDSSKGETDPQEDKQNKAAGKKTKVYHIAKEIMSSEKVFVDVLKLLHIDFRDAVAHASRQLGKPVIEDRILNQILYYLPQLYELNRDLLRELEERLSHWLEHQRIADIFVKKGPYLKMYSTYIKEFDKNVALLDEQCKKNAGFASVVKDFEMSPRCASLALKHYLLKPVQRIPQYRLLLTDYLKNLLEESADYRDTQDALAVVIEVANHANDIMKQGDNFQKLMQIQYSLNGHHEIVQPGRVFLKEGTLMKLSRKVMQPRMFFLFNDALLYTTPVQSGMYKLNNMLSLAGMKVKKPTQEAYQNELNIESVERSFILSASSATERDEWLEAISKSIEEYTKKRITFNPSKSLEEADPEKQEEDSPLGSKAPIWIPDTRATMCMICTSEFTLTWRRHHCRACGKIVCQACSSNKHGLDYMKNQPARVCDHCFRELQKQDNQCTPKSGSPVNHKSPSSALSTVLHSIPSGRKQKKIPAALKEVSANTEDSTMSGYLHRSKGSKKPWKHLWFVIKNKVLYTYAASEDVAALESQPLLGFTVSEVKDENSESRVFHLLHKNTLFYIFKADDPHSAQKWIEAFQEGTVL
ncbi:PREDICTED: FYVE, RhoGEF and PH domain-containing protein 6 [Lepidothrix coronata]|uniref:FYVE, RhoGEF and PH domain-containing protein 6 n=1 Tax=Lepidothrix coronata TaxID=321398 RepID=A0A6J0G8Z9_9PASS|nr:PREDICTED: FYVE, RhoGEF and PH domain-containing protein 6 [Lepidothrix coronata]